MAEIALRRQQVTQGPEAAGTGTPLYQRRNPSTSGPVELIPNPDFVFPQPAPNSSDSNTNSSRRPMSLQALPTSRRGSSGGMRQQKSISTLPDFSFNPSGTGRPSTATATTPPHSPIATTPTTPSRNIGHRRGGSELIGGDARSGGIGLLSSSPTKGESVLPPPSAGLRSGPPAGRRGHAHRRSGAISSHDLSSILQPTDGNAPNRSGSAPATPMENDMKSFAHSMNKSVSQPSLHSASMEESGLFQDDSSPRRPPSRTRVGFSDRVEYIRPLSTISSETESSLSTIRGHSVSGSLSSVISSGAASPPSARMARPSLNTTFEDESRPSTAGAVLDMKDRSSGLGGELFSRKRPMSAVAPNSPVSASSPITPRIPAKRRSFFRLDQRRADPLVPLPSPLQSSASEPSLLSAGETPPTSPAKVPDEVEASETATEKPKSTQRKAPRKPRKVKSWANSIISRKGRRQSLKVKSRTATPPPQVSPAAEEDSEDLEFEADFDADNTVTIVSPSANENQRPRLGTDIASWKPREFTRHDSDAMSPVIDLDAALGPFNTPLGPNARGHGRGYSVARRTMHSAGGIIQNHRRTESAPELVPFELRAATIANTITMADVFEEEEEEDSAMTEEKAAVPTDTVTETEEEVEEPNIGIQVVDADDVHNGSAINWNFDDGLRIKQGEKARKRASIEELVPLEVPKVREATPVSSDRRMSREPMDISPVEVVEDFEEPRTSSLTRSSDSTITPTASGDDTKEPQHVMNLTLPLPQHNLMTPDTFTSSSFSSPDFRSSQTSFDTPRLGTAASSITDYRTINSVHFGEPGPELRVSVDDVPSLTSSRSTMTSALHNTFPMISPRNPGERSSSLCSAPSDTSDQRRRKRSSIASLSRLINGSSFGEKSKLSIEQRPHSEHLEPVKDPKAKKHKRLSRMMQFWKSKDSSSRS